MKREEFAEVMFNNALNPQKLDAYHKNIVKNIAAQVSMLFSVNPEECRSVLQQLNSQITDALLEKAINANAVSKDAYIQEVVSQLEEQGGYIFDKEVDEVTCD